MDWEVRVILKHRRPPFFRIDEAIEPFGVGSDELESVVGQSRKLQ
jgi:hypothetical protein